MIDQGTGQAPPKQPVAAPHPPLPQPTFTTIRLVPIDPIDILPDSNDGAEGPAPRPLPPTEPARTLALPKAARPLGNPALWVTPNDYPTADLRMNHAGAVGFTLAISPEGKVSGCTVTRTSRYPGLDAATCALLAARARFAPATDETGDVVAGSWSSTVRWQIPE